MPTGAARIRPAAPARTALARLIVPTRGRPMRGCLVRECLVRERRVREHRLRGCRVGSPVEVLPWVIATGRGRAWVIADGRGSRPRVIATCHGERGWMITTGRGSRPPVIIPRLWGTLV